MKQKKNITEPCRLCKHITFNDSLLNVGRCSNPAKIVNLSDIKSCFVHFLEDAKNKELKPVKLLSVQTALDF